MVLVPLREAVDGGLRLVGLVGGARHQRVAGCAADAGSMQIGNRYADERNRQNKDDDAQDADGFLRLAAASAGLK